MRTKQDKSEFLKALKNEIKNREALRKFFDTTFQELLISFDGKVYNKRFDNALNEALKAVSPLMRAKCELKSRNIYSNFSQNNTVNVALNYRNSESNYLDNEIFYTNIVLTTDQNYNLRISANDSKSENYTIAWAKNFDKETETRKGIIKQYDKFLKVANHVEKAMKEYNDLPHRFREHMDTNYLRLY